MTIRIVDIVPLSIARARFSELADDARGGGEKIITKNGAAYVALIDARRLDHYHRLEREQAKRPGAAPMRDGGAPGADGAAERAPPATDDAAADARGSDPPPAVTRAGID